MANILAVYAFFILCAIYKSAYALNRNISSPSDDLEHTVIPKKSDSDIGEQDNKKSATHELFIFTKISFLEFIKVLSSRLFEHKKPLDFTSVPGVSSECRRDFSHYLSALKNFDWWALKSKLIKHET